MEEESGEALRTRIIKIAIPMMESINLIKNMDKVHLLGQVEILIMDRITEMIETDKE